MLHDTILFLGTIVMPTPDFAIPPSDSDPIHHFSTRDRRSTSNLTTRKQIYHEVGSIFPVSSNACKRKHETHHKEYLLLQLPSSRVVGSCIPSKFNSNASCPCILFRKSGEAALALLASASYRVESSLGHRREPATLTTPIKYKTLAALKQPPSGRNTGRRNRDEMLVSELGELSSRKTKLRLDTKSKTKGKIKAALDIWSRRRSTPVTAKLADAKIETSMSSLELKIKVPRTKRQDAGSSLLSLPSRGDRPNIAGQPRRNTLPGNGLGSPQSRPNGALPVKTRSVAMAPESGPEKNGSVVRHPAPRPPVSFEVDLSPIIEDVQSFPSLVDIDCTFEGLHMIDSKSERIPVQEPQIEDDSRNLDHVNLSSSFVLQSASLVDLQSHNEDNQSLPALVLTFPTPEPPSLSKFSPTNSQQGGANLSVPTFPRCTHCGFGFGLDFHDLEVPYASKPCRLCEPQWLACKPWYQTNDKASTATYEESTAQVNATSDDRRVVGPKAADEHGQLRVKPTEVPTQQAGEGYARFSNVIINDKTNTTKTSKLWTKLTRFFGRSIHKEPIPARGPKRVFGSRNTGLLPLFWVLTFHGFQSLGCLPGIYASSNVYPHVTPMSVSHPGPRRSFGSRLRAAGSTTLLHFRKHTGLGIVCAVAYLDPGNWSVDLQAGSDHGFRLLFIVLVAGLFAAFLQVLATRLGCVTGLDLASHCRVVLYDRPKHKLLYRRVVLYPLYVVSEIAIVATDLAELLGSAIALVLLFPSLEIWQGVLITSADVLFLIALRDPLRSTPVKMFEALIALLVLAVLVCMVIVVAKVHVEWGKAFDGFLPSRELFGSNGLYTSVGILGATVMPHSLFLGSTLATQRRVPVERDELKSEVTQREEAVQPPSSRWGRVSAFVKDCFRAPPPSAHATLVKRHVDRENNSFAFVQKHLNHAIFDVVGSLVGFAILINSMILIIAAMVFHFGRAGTDRAHAASLFDAYNVIHQLVGKAAATLFAVALLAAGQSSSIIATIAGQAVAEGFLNWRVSPILRRLLTRLIAVVPSMAVAIARGRQGIDGLLVASQVILAIVLPFLIMPLVLLTSSKTVMRVRKPDSLVGESELATDDMLDYSSGKATIVVGLAIWLVIATANVYVIATLLQNVLT
ncbi:hypothetical protein MIND_00523100 [Mycena indigotica]|uniref:Nramp-domain-containing protein n=1 Tax=Mycena indigotica TaxID=2126181 RepID=A0A8H6W8T5_9AGAR|nr:uncharacterized protein MIND_00523100 [Mycena indigotica]KAF7307291.1 hypothetical protein MIND_00523100 [Mycena indigotica]